MNEQQQASHIKLLFEVDTEDGGTEIESLWALPVAKGYKIDNIPFYAKEVACNDIVSADPDEDGMLWFTGLVEASGHSTIRLWFASRADVAQVRNTLRQMGCSSELDVDRLVAVDIPPDVPYESVREYFDQQESAGVFEYEEACLGQG
jgi:hypothetical protein